MTPLTALPIQLGTTLPVEAAGGSRGESAETADFSALLALQPGSTEPAAQGPTITAPQPFGVPMDPADPAILPLPGKILPPALPEAVAPAAPEATEHPATEGAPVRAEQPRIAVRTALTLRGARTASAPAPDEPATEDEVPAPANPVRAEAPLDRTQPAVQAAALPLVASPPEGTASPPPAITPADQQTARPVTRPDPAPIRAQAKPAVQPHPQTPDPAASTVTLLAEAALPFQPVAATLTVRPGRPVAMASVPAMRRSPAVAAPEAPVLTSEPAPLTAPLLTSDRAPVTTAAPALPVSEPAARPHDFAALVDRLAAAREAVQPQAVSIAVAHQEFGPVRLHFRHEDGVLSVALASADPDFARAVAAAPPVPAPAPSEAGGFQPGPRSTDSGPSGQSRGGTNGAPRDERTPHGNPSPAGPPRRNGAGQQGIFA